MTEKEKLLGAWLSQIADELNITDTMLDKAVSSYEAVGKWLSDGIPQDVKITPQGSMNLGTVIRPISDKDEYDVDLVCLLKNGSTLPLSYIKSVVGDRLKEHGTYQRMLEPEGKRCWTMQYDEFHMDILPCVPKDMYYVEPNWTSITPREIVHYMCQESLINYLTNKMGVSEDAIRDFILYGDYMKDEDTNKEKRQRNGGMLISEELYKLNPDGSVAVNRLLEVDKALQDVRVADPAVGSGAFPLGMLNEIVRARQNISAYAGVVCMDIERLSRGSSMESGYIMQVLQVNGCKIITPGKTYDLQNDADEQFTDMKFMFSRYELKTINSRLVRGRNHSASEGKYMGSMAPYGYRIVKLPGEKGNSLTIEPEEARVVRMIYDMYGQQGMGYNAIAYKLNDLHIPARKGLWSQTSVVNILSNETYLGIIRWRYEPTKRVVKDGMLAKKRIINDDYELYDGRHEPIITQEQWDLARAAQSKRYHQPTHTDRHLQNPFAGILYCERCGAGIKRKIPRKGRTCIPWYQCPTRTCDCKMIKCEVVENAILEAMEDWLREYTLQIDSKEAPKVNPIETALETVRGQLAGLLQQQENICEYLEKGIYTVEMFNKRNTSLAQEIKKLQASESDLMEQLRGSDSQKKGALQIIPATQHILDHYENFTTEEKNRLWKLVLKKVTVYRSQEDELTIHLYPNLPQ